MGIGSGRILCKHDRKRFRLIFLCIVFALVAGADQRPVALPDGLHDLWQGGDRCGEPTVEQLALTSALDPQTAAEVVDEAKVIPYRFIVEDLIAAAGIGGGNSQPVQQTIKTRSSSGGLIYMKGRYYDPEIGRFLTEDPAVPDLMTPPSLHEYLYAHANPTAYVDPTGEAAESIWDAASLGVGLASLGYNLYQGQYRDAGIDTFGVLADTAALALPFIPGGAGVAIKAGRAGSATAQQADRARRLTRNVDAVQAIDQAVNVVDGTDRAAEALEQGHFGEAAFNAGMAALGARGTVANTSEAFRPAGLPSVPEARRPPPSHLMVVTEGGELAPMMRPFDGKDSGTSPRLSDHPFRNTAQDNPSISNLNRRGLSLVESSIAKEAQGILSSHEFQLLRAAQEQGHSFEALIGGRIVIYQPDAPVSGMTLFGEEGFLIGREAFQSEPELIKTVLHEVYRLRSSRVGATGAVSQAAAAKETAATADFAERA